MILSAVFPTDLERMVREDIIKQVNGEDAADFRFHIMCVNVWMEMDSTKDIVPCEQLSTLSSCDWFLIFSILFIIVLGEIGLVEMSLKHGIIRKYNQLIHPGVIPTGYRADIKINGEKYHGVFLNNPELVDDYKDSN